MQGRENQGREKYSRWTKTLNQECANLILENVREDARRDAFLKMRTEARCERISGTQLIITNGPFQIFRKKMTICVVFSAATFMAQFLTKNTVAR